MSLTTTISLDLPDYLPLQDPQSHVTAIDQNIAPWLTNGLSVEAEIQPVAPPYIFSESESDCAVMGHKNTRTWDRDTHDI